MLTLKDFLEITNYQYTDTQKYGWKCFGDAAQYMDYWNRAQDGFQLTILHDLLTPTVYSVEVSDFKKNKAWRWINPEYKQAHDEEAASRGVDSNQAWDDVNYKTVDEQEILNKARKLWNRFSNPKQKEEVLGPATDESKSDIELDLSDKEMLQLALEAHKRDITLNQMVELILLDAIERAKDE